MKIPEVVEKWFIRAYGGDSYLLKAREFTDIEPNKIVGFIFDNHLERMVRLKAEGGGVQMTDEEDLVMSRWLSEEMVLATLRYRKVLADEREDIRLKVRKNIENYAPKSARVIFEEDLKPRSGRQDR